MCCTARCALLQVCLATVAPYLSHQPYSLCTWLGARRASPRRRRARRCQHPGVGRGCNHIARAPHRRATCMPARKGREEVDTACNMRLCVPDTRCVLRHQGTSSSFNTSAKNVRITSKAAKTQHTPATITAPCCSMPPAPHARKHASVASEILLHMHNTYPGVKALRGCICSWRNPSPTCTTGMDGAA